MQKMEITFRSTVGIMKKHLSNHGCHAYGSDDNFLFWRIEEEYDSYGDWQKPFKHGDIVAYQGIKNSDFWFRVVPDGSDDCKIITTPESFLWFIKEIDLEGLIVDDPYYKMPMTDGLSDLCEFKEVKSQAYCLLAERFWTAFSNMKTDVNTIFYRNQLWSSRIFREEN